MADQSSPGVASNRTIEETRAGTKPPLVFPEDLRDAPHYMILTPFKYSRETALSNDAGNRVLSSTRNEGNERPGSFEDASAFGRVFSGANRGGSPIAPTFKVDFDMGQMIALPLPVQLSDSLSLSFNATDMGVTAAGFQAGQAIGRAEFGLEDALGSGGYAFRTLAQVSEQISTLINLMTGNVPNPYSVLSFRNVEQRTFNFDWTFSPKSEKESRMLRDIINTMRYFSLPDQNGLFLEFPHEFEIQFVGTSFLYSMSRGYITDLKVEYGSSGGNSFYAIEENGNADGAPSVVKFSFTFKEIYPLNKTLLIGNETMRPSPQFIGSSEQETVQADLGAPEGSETTDSSPVTTSGRVSNFFSSFRRATSGPPIR